MSLTQREENLQRIKQINKTMSSPAPKKQEEVTKAEAMQHIKQLNEAERNLADVQEKTDAALSNFTVYEIEIHSEDIDDGLDHTYSNKDIAVKMSIRLDQVNITHYVKEQWYTDAYDVYNGDHEFTVDDLDAHESLILMIEKHQRRIQKDDKKSNKRKHNDLEN